MSRSPLRVLVVSSDPDLIQLLEEAFLEWSETRWRHAGHPDFERIHALDAGEAVETLEAARVDAVLADAASPFCLNAPDWDRVRAASVDAPLLALTASEEEGFRLLRRGAQDFLVAAELDCVPLARALRGAVERFRFGSANRHAALTDEVTGLYNQRGFLEIAGRQGLLASRSGVAVAVSMVECETPIDDGEGTMMAALHVAGRLRELAEETDILARWDDRRFAALCPVRDHLAAASFGDAVPVRRATVTIAPGAEFDLSGALAAAEQALCQNRQESARSAGVF
ncbi:MAG: hypothetical protein U0Q16_29025 [Bryobacteraceae bacterium]